MATEQQTAQKILREDSPRATIDFAYHCFVDQNHSFLLLLGWARLKKGERLLLVGKDGKPVLLNNVYFTRNDIRELYGPCFNPEQSGYGLVAFVEAEPYSGDFLLVIADAPGINYTHNFTTKACYGVRNLLNLLFELPIPDYELKNVFAMLLPKLGLALAIDAQATVNTSLAVEAVGQVSVSPQFSLLVGPVYEKETLLTQLFAFADDAELKTNAELIYVLDDTPEQRELVSILRSQASLLRVPCKIVSLTCPTSAAVLWNCASLLATGSSLVFINSGAIPELPGWLSILEKRRGAVGSAYKDIMGAIHSGMFITGQEALIDSPVPGAYYGGPVLLCPKEVFHSLGGFNPVFQLPETAFMDLYRRIRVAKINFYYEKQSILTAIAEQHYHKKTLLLDLLFYKALEPASEMRLAAESVANPAAQVGV